MPDMTAREARHSLGIVNLLDQFLDTQHSLPKREAISAELGIKTTELEDLITDAKNSVNPDIALIARVNLNLIMAGAGRKTR